MSALFFETRCVALRFTKWSLWKADYS